MTGLSTILARDCEMSIRTTNCLRLQYGDDVTLAHLDALTDDEILRTPHFGRRSLKEIREVIANVKASLPPPRPKLQLFPGADEVKAMREWSGTGLMECRRVLIGRNIRRALADPDLGVDELRQILIVMVDAIYPASPPDDGAERTSFAG